MFLRMVEAMVKPNEEHALERVYSEEILNQLENISGCIFAGLLHSRENTRNYISLTLWQTEDDAVRYNDSGNYQKNLALVQALLEEGNEWKIRLSENNIVEYSPIPIEPSVRTYPVAGEQEDPPAHLSAKSNYLRILSLKVNLGHKEEFTRIYNGEILPLLKKVNGCRYAFLLDNSENESEMISLSIWDSPQSVEVYELEGPYKAFLEKINHTLGGLYQWKMALETRSKTKKAVTSQDIGISTYTLITGKKFKLF